MNSIGSDIEFPIETKSIICWWPRILNNSRMILHITNILEVYVYGGGIGVDRTVEAEFRSVEQKKGHWF
jgi:hypothetical protein